MLDDILKKVQKPTRYTANEYNSVIKDPESVAIRYAFCFPDVYEVGMSHLGMKILYHMLNSREDTYCERVFAPWTDMEEELRKAHIPLFALESRDPLTKFDFLGFTLQYEMSYSNILNMLDLAGIPLLASERDITMPFVHAGGPCAFNPEPLADFIDFFCIGEGEEISMEIMDEYLVWKNSGESRNDFLRRIAKIDGVYVPSFYDVGYNKDNTIAHVKANTAEAKPKITKRIVKDLDKAYYPEKMIVPYMEIVHDRIMLEIFRGCIRGCRFCQAGMIYRPVREKSVDRLIEIAKNLMQSTGYEEISLASLSTSDYKDLEKLTSALVDITEQERVSLSLPSLRIDNFSLDLMEKVQKVRKSGLTFAPEAGTQRMRDIINKGVTEEDLLKSARLAFSGGWTGIKLYFMIGLPYETIEDCIGIAHLAKKVLDEYFSIPKEQRPKGLRLTVSASSFVPKAFTPFQWAKQDDMNSLREKQRAIINSITSKQIQFNYHESKLSVLEGVFARGDRRLSKVLLAAHKRGCKFDSWSEHFHLENWLAAFEDCGIAPEFYTREREYEEILPWDIIDCGVSKDFLISENEKAKRAEVTPNCRSACSMCGAMDLFGGVCCE